MIAVAEYVNVVGAIDLGGLDLRPLCLLRQPCCCEPGGAQRDRDGCKPNLRHDDSALTLLRAASPVSAAPPCCEL